MSHEHEKLGSKVNFRPGICTSQSPSSSSNVIYLKWKDLLNLAFILCMRTQTHVLKILEARGLVFILRVKYSGNYFVWKLILGELSSKKADLERIFSTLQYLQIDFTFLNLMHQKNVKRIASCLRALNINYGRVPFREVSLYMFKVEVLTLHCGREQSYFYRY